jgi:flagellum-specific peptidoglycan hydrolase FlgJ
MKRSIFTGLATAAVVTTAAVPVTNTVSSFIGQPVTYQAQAALSASQNSFLTAAIPQAQAAAYKYGVYPSVMLAQAIIESGWGQSTLSQSPNNNLFGIKGSYNGQSVTMPTTEYNSNGQSYQTNAQFRKYPNYQASFEDNGALLRNGISGNPQYYINTWLENANSYQNATAGLQGRYATAPNYSANLNAVIATYGLSKYDPQISWQNTTATAKRNATIYNWPTAPSVATAIGSVRAGQKVQVSEFITNYDGSRFAKVSGGWVDANALGDANKPINNGTSNNQNNNNNSQKPTTPTKPTKPTNNDGVTPASGAVQINYVPDYGIAVWTAPGGRPTGQTLKHGTTWKITGTKMYNGAKWYRVGRNQWIPAQYTAAPGTVKMPDLKPKHETTPDYIKESGAVQIDYVPDYGIAVWSAPGGHTTGQTLKHGTTWKTFGYKYVNGQKWLNVGHDQWIQAKYAATPGSVNVTGESYTRQAGTAQVHYVSGYGIAVWREPGRSTTGQFLKDGTTWKTFGYKYVNGQKWLNVGKNQWIQASYTGAFDPSYGASHSMERRSGVVQVNSAQGTNVWQEAGSKTTSRKLDNGSAWRFYGTKTVNGETWYNLGGSQWVPARYVMELR